MGKKVEPRPVPRPAYIWGHGHTAWDPVLRKMVPITYVIRDEQGVAVEWG